MFLYLLFVYTNTVWKVQKTVTQHHQHTFLRTFCSSNGHLFNTQYITILWYSCHLGPSFTLLYLRERLSFMQTSSSPIISGTASSSSSLSYNDDDDAGTDEKDSPADAAADDAPLPATKNVQFLYTGTVDSGGTFSFPTPMGGKRSPTNTFFLSTTLIPMVSPTLRFDSNESSMYPSQALEDFHPPALLIIVREAPLSAKNEAPILSTTKKNWGV